MAEEREGYFKSLAEQFVIEQDGAPEQKQSIEDMAALFLTKDPRTSTPVDDPNTKPAQSSPQPGTKEPESNLPALEEEFALAQLEQEPFTPDSNDPADANAPVIAEKLDQAGPARKPDKMFLEALAEEWTSVDAVAKKVPIIGGVYATEQLLHLESAVGRLKGGWDYSKPDPILPNMLMSGDPEMDLLATQYLPLYHNKAADIKLVEDATLKLEEEMSRALTIGGKIAKGLSVLPTWMMEFYLTGGLNSFGSEAAKKAGTKLMNRALQNRLTSATTKKLITNKLGKDIIKRGLSIAEGTAGAVVRTTVGLVPRVTEETARRQTDIALGIAEPEGWATSLAYGWANVFIETASESAGGAITRNLSKVGNALPFSSKFKDLVKAGWLKLDPENTKALWAQKTLTRAGYHGIIGELGEERLATIMHSIAETEDYGLTKDASTWARIGAGLKQDAQLSNIGSEALVLMIPGAVRFSISRFYDGMAKFSDNQLKKRALTDIAAGKANILPPEKSPTNRQQPSRVLPDNKIQVYQGTHTNKETGNTTTNRAHGTAEGADQSLSDKETEQGEHLGTPNIATYELDKSEVAFLDNPLSQTEETPGAQTGEPARAPLQAYEENEQLAEQLKAQGYKAVAYHDSVDDPGSVGYLILDDTGLVPSTQSDRALTELQKQEQSNGPTKLQLADVTELNNQAEEAFQNNDLNALAEIEAELAGRLDDSPQTQANYINKWAYERAKNMRHIILLENLDKLNGHDVQRIARERGINAFQKRDTLVKQIKQSIMEDGSVAKNVVKARLSEVGTRRSQGLSDHPETVERNETEQGHIDRIHEGEEVLNLSDDAYRSFLFDITGKTSTREMTEKELETVAVEMNKRVSQEGIRSGAEKIGLTEKELNNLTSSTKGEFQGEALDTVLNHYMAGQKLPDAEQFPYMRRQQINELKNLVRSISNRVGLRQRQATNSTTAFDRIVIRAQNDFGDFRSMRYWMAGLDSQYGRRAYEKHLDLEMARRNSIEDSRKIFEDIFKSHGLNPKKLGRISREEANIIGGYLDAEAGSEKEAELFASLTKEQQAIAAALSDIVHIDPLSPDNTGIAAKMVRSYRYKIWKTAHIKLQAANIKLQAKLDALTILQSQLEETRKRSKTKDKIKINRAKKANIKQQEEIAAEIQKNIDTDEANLPPKATLDMMDVLMAEEQKGHGSYMAALSRLDFGTRKSYYMTDTDFGAAIKALLNATNLDFTTKEKGDTGVPVNSVAFGDRSVNSRQGDADMLLNRNPVDAVMQHLQRVSLLESTYYPLQSLHEEFSGVRVTPNQRDVLLKYQNNLLNVFEHAGLAARVASTIKHKFWQMKGADPTFLARFTIRNLGQSGLGAAHIDLARAPAWLIKSLVNPNPNLKEDFNTYLHREIIDRMHYYNQMGLLDSSTVGLYSGSWAGWQDFGAKQFAASDTINRMLTWRIFHEGGYNSVQEFANGKITDKELSRRLKLDILPGPQRTMLQNLLVEKDYDLFVRRYAQFKTQNIQYSYETTAKSAHEQTVGNKPWMGVMTWSRSAVEQYNLAGQAMINGYKNGDGQMFRQGVYFYTKFALSFAGLSAFYKWLTGGEDDLYGLFNSIAYFPGSSPEVDTILNTIEMGNRLFKVLQDPDKDLEEKLTKTLDFGINSLGFYFAPALVGLLDGLKTGMETIDDTQGITRVEAMRSFSNRYILGEPYKYFELGSGAEEYVNRDANQKFWHMAVKGKKTGNTDIDESYEDYSKSKMKKMWDWAN